MSYPMSEAVLVHVSGRLGTPLQGGWVAPLRTASHPLRRVTIVNIGLWKTNPVLAGC